jgi:nuclease S1
VSFEDDIGGGKIRQRGTCRGDLHSTWDSCIIQELGTTVSDIANDLVQEITPAERASWIATPVEVWATESLTIARRPDVAYCVQVGGKCRYDVDREEFTGGQEKSVKVDTDYLATQKTTVADRLKQAGVRLGKLLNESLGR